MITAIPYANIQANQIVLYEYLEGLPRGKGHSEISKENLKNNDCKGLISDSARKRIIQGVNTLCVLSFPKPWYNPTTGKISRIKTVLLTLTLPSRQVHTDGELKRKALNRLLEVLRTSYKMQAYLWRAEAQANGSLHFHISTNILIHHKELRNIWNRTLEPLGYIDEFEKVHGHRNPNSTDVHAVFKVKNLGAYLAKYMAKDGQYRPVEGRQWFLSTALSRIPKLSIIYDGVLRQELDHFIKTQAEKQLQLEHAFIAYACFFTANLKQYPNLQKLRQDYVSAYATSIN